jgi:hypothetical protein
MILPCKCAIPFQDENYGKGMRVHNPTKKANDSGEHRCTGCSTIHYAPRSGGADKKAKGKK